MPHTRASLPFGSIGWADVADTERSFAMSEEGNRRDVYQDVTDRIVFSIEQGANKFDTFELPWYRGGVTQRRPTNARTGNRYRGINVIGLWAAALANDFGSGFWAT